MLRADSHTHSNHSFDATQTMEELCRCAIDRGLDCVALTDHYDIDGILDGFYPDYDITAAIADVERCREMFAGKLDLVLGIEIGQPHLREREAHDFIRRFGIEFIIASLHNLDRVPDYIFLNYETIPYPLIDSLYERYVRELCKAAAFPGAHTLAHTTYPVRYIRRDGKDLDTARFYDLYKELFAVLIDRGVALELNTSGIRKGYGISPDEGLLRLYKACGGELVSCGSDAHESGDVGADVDAGVELLRTIGFKYLVIPARGGAETIKIT